MGNADVPDIDLDEIEASTEPSATFRLGGRQWTCRHGDAIDADVLSDVMGGGAKVRDFFAAVLVPGEIADFMVALDEARGSGLLSVARVNALSDHLVAAVFGRPTLRSAPSGPGPQTTGQSSGAGSSSRAKPSKRSAA
jgi:hypothetical protein